MRSRPAARRTAPVATSSAPRAAGALTEASSGAIRRTSEKRRRWISFGSLGRWEQSVRMAARENGHRLELTRPVPVGGPPRQLADRELDAGEGFYEQVSWGRQISDLYEVDAA